MLVDGLNAWLLDTCPGFLILTRLVLCHPCEKAAKHYPAPAPVKLNLPSEEGKGPSSKTRSCMLVTWILPPHPCLCIDPFLPASSEMRTGCVAGMYRVAGAGASRVPLCRPGWKIIWFSFNMSEKKESALCPTLFFVSRQCHQFYGDIRAPAEKSTLDPAQGASS